VKRKTQTIQAKPAQTQALHAPSVNRTARSKNTATQLLHDPIVDRTKAPRPASTHLPHDQIVDRTKPPRPKDASTHRPDDPIVDRPKPKAPLSKNAPSHLLHDHIVDRTTRLADAMVRMSSRHVKQRWKLRHTDLRLLNVLDGEQPITVLEISRRALVDQAWVSRSLRALEARKLVERSSDPVDSRLTLVALTQRGRATLNEFRPWAAWSEKLLLKGVDEQKLKALLDQLEANTETLFRSIVESSRPPPKNPPRQR
jgi:DNA-binding MarR family transcriptional regulator